MSNVQLYIYILKKEGVLLKVEESRDYLHTFNPTAWKWNWDGIRNKKQAFMVLWQQLFAINGQKKEQMNTVLDIRLASNKTLSSQFDHSPCDQIK